MEWCSQFLYLSSMISMLYYVYDDKHAFKKPRRNPLVLAAPHMALTEYNLLLTEQNLTLTVHC